MTWRASDAIVDTSALLYLHLAGALSLFETLFARELDAVGDLPVGDLRPSAGRHAASRPGELAVLRLGLELAGSVVVLDDGAARATARSLGLTITGTLGILLEAKRAGLIAAMRPVMDQIQAEGFRLDPATREIVLSLAGERD